MKKIFCWLGFHKRNSVCCGAKCLNRADSWRRKDQKLPDEFICNNCGKPFVGGKCTAGESMEKVKENLWKKLKPIGKYWLEVETDTPYRIVLHRKDSGTWSDSVRAMSHLMKEIVQLELELQRPV